ncbi:MAG TPA: T6SS effector amidase Tae4 family protein, partial [Niastella sp.]
NIIGATNLSKFLLKFGKPEDYNGMNTNVVSKITGRTGIIYFENIIEDGVRSHTNVHIELWDKDHYQSGFVFEQMFSGTTILFWEIK